MSHLARSKETNFPNYGATVNRRFCHQPGKERIEPEKTLGNFSIPFINDVTHFHQKFFVISKELLLKPGLLFNEYIFF